MSEAGFGRDVNEFLRACGAADNPCRNGEEPHCGVSVRSVGAMGDEKVKICVRVANLSGSEETEFVLLSEHAEQMELAIGPLDAEMLPELEYWAEVARAYSAACASFAFTQSSLRALAQKLAQKGFARDVCDDAIACVRLRGFVNEGEIALRRAQLCVEKHWGRSRVLMKLREEGFEGSSMEAARAYLAEVDFVRSCAALIKKKFGGVPEDRHERELMYASLARMGYSSADIRAAVRSEQG